jgi:hypothetical protein
MNRPPGPRGADAVRALARVVSGRPLEACTGLFARYGDTVYLPVRPWKGLCILSRPEQAEYVLGRRVPVFHHYGRGQPLAKGRAAIRKLDSTRSDAR